MRWATHPAGAAIAPLATIRDHSAGIWPGRCLDLAIASTAATAPAPASAAAAIAFLPWCAVSAAPASAPITPAGTACRSRPAGSPAIRGTYRLPERRGAVGGSEGWKEPRLLAPELGAWPHDQADRTADRRRGTGRVGLPARWPADPHPHPRLRDRALGR